ncbi:aldehyde dehydrogenase family protein [Paraburkholderia phenoliruptrix]|uniref:aldehyde dehydrogenase family protein n=1 Tax=Paraburkholderia phenoliruptrix TaxID=252970 RepID=UPI001C6E8731|nr:aldehyde dehydrogenase family protein [Paraburkholderia phenoliruptrix]MBW9107420.1 aldehyde dehydrogenase family protein [Paraburkholderia phenoliruptrix]MBW9128158.1 aldehyde dehydrogenase family protein [Paraburkholderia ginsengiterrae]
MDRQFNISGGHRAAGGDWYAVENPAFLTPIAEAPLTAPQALDDAVASASAALGSWAKDPMGRRNALKGCAALLASNLEDLAVLLSREQGKPLPAAKREILSAKSYLEYFADKTVHQEVILRDTNRTVVALSSPVGVVGLIVPWNFPLVLLMMKLAPALWAGNTVVVKPAPTTPLTTLAVASLFAACLPPGVLNTVTGGADVGASLVSHEGVAKISFTGSTPTGKKIMESAAQTLKRLTLELGGNDAAVVLQDADLETSAPLLFERAFMNAGQVCCAVKRLFVHRSLYEPLVEKMVAIAKHWRVGPGLNEGVQMGPLNNRQQFEHVKGLLDDAVAGGGRIVAGGDTPPDWPGHFIRPAIVVDITDSRRLVREEQFGPALPILPFDDEDEAIARANASEFGLGGSVWSRDIERATALVSRLEAVNLFVNQHATPPEPAIPFGGMKSSGFGYEFGDWGLDEFVVRKVLHSPVGGMA